MTSDPQNRFSLPEEEGIDIKKYIFNILTNWWWFAITIFVTVTVAYLVNRYSQELYNISCTLIIGDPDSRVGSTENILDELARARGRRRKAVVDNEISILKSYKMARLSLEELDFGITYTAVGRRNIAESQLYTACPFIVKIDTTKLNYPEGRFDVVILSQNEYTLEIGDNFQKVLRFGDYFEKDDYGFIVHLRDSNNFEFSRQKSNKYYFIYNDINSLAKSYSNSLNVEVNADKGSILTLSMAGYVPEQIASYLNKLSEVYIRTNLEEKNLTSENTIHFIDRQLRGIVDSLEVTGLRLQKFRSDNKVINLSNEGTFLFEKLQGLQSEKATLDIKDRYYKYLLEYIKKRADFSDVVAPSVVGIGDQLLNTLVAELNQLNLQRRNLNLTVVEDSPQIVVLNNQIENTRNALYENLQSLIAANTIAINDIDERIIDIELEVQKLPGTERQLINIEREFTINDQIYTFLLEKRAEAGITKASNLADHKILDLAIPKNSYQIKPKASFNYIIALMLGVSIPLLILILIQFFNNKIQSKNDIEKNISVPILGSIGHNNNKTEIPVFESPKTALAESFRALRASLQFLLKETEEKVIAISSTISGEGKTFCAVNLASILAMSGRRTLLIGMDLRRPKIHRIFNIENKHGLSTYLIGKSSHEEIIQSTNIDNLSIVNSGPVPPNPAELIGSESMMDFLSEMKQKFDYVIIDTPPVAIVTDAILINDLISAYVFVIRHDYSNKNVLGLVNDLNLKRGVKNISVLINDVQVRGYYGYNYDYGYNYSYGYSQSGYYDEGENDLSFGAKLIKKITNKFYGQ